MKKRIVCLMLSIMLVSLVVTTGCKVDGQNNYKSLQDFTVKNVVATDSLGRTFTVESSEDRKQYVGMWYLFWMNIPSAEIHDYTKLNENNPDLIWKLNEGTPMGAFHYWSEPLYGYYNSEDEWVMRKHIEQFIFAGIDFLYFDCTNAFTYDSSWKKFLPILVEYKKAGWKVPEVVFYCSSYTKKTIEHLYEQIYKPEFCKDVWFSPNGKPMIIGWNRESEDLSETEEPFLGYGTERLSDEIKSFFDIQERRWPVGETKNYGFPWIDLKYPQTNYSGVMSVSVSQHTGMPISDSVKPSANAVDYNKNYGRGYDHLNKHRNMKDGINKGLNLEQQWATALEQKAELNYIMVTGWNEWIAQKLQHANNTDVQFVDSCNLEFSRDIEMMKGGYGDNYYMQLIRNMRQLNSNTVVKSKINTPKEFGLFLNDSSYSNLGATYLDLEDEIGERNHIGFSSNIVYTDTSARNDIVKTRVVNTSKDLFVFVETKNDITEYKEGDKNFMNILLSVNKQSKYNWEGYDFVLNRNIVGKKSSIERANGFDYSWEKVGDADIRIERNRMVVRIPLKTLGIKNDKINIDFKVTDNVTKPNDIMDYYVSGDCAPIGRLNYRYEN